MAISDSKEREVTTRQDGWSEEYKFKIFNLWYTSGKPGPAMLVQMVDEDDPMTDQRPNQHIITNWIYRDFVKMAMPIDDDVSKALQKQLVADKLEVMEYQAGMARELYDMGMDWLREKGLGNSRTALTAVVQGMQIERETRGAPQILGNIAKLNDQELLNVFMELADESEVMKLEPNEPDKTLSNM